MTNDNGYRELLCGPSRPTCHASGKPVDLKSDGALVKTIEHLWSHDVDGIMWHQRDSTEFSMRRKTLMAARTDVNFPRLS